jgi:hypothetical protein
MHIKLKDVDIIKNYLVYIYFGRLQSLFFYFMKKNARKMVHHNDNRLQKPFGDVARNRSVWFHQTLQDAGSSLILTSSLRKNWKFFFINKWYKRARLYPFSDKYGYIALPLSVGRFGRLPVRSLKLSRSIMNTWAQELQTWYKDWPWHINDSYWFCVYQPGFRVSDMLFKEREYTFYKHLMF